MKPSQRSLQAPQPGSAERPVIQFGAFELNSRAGELRKHGSRVRLQNKPFRILELLLERPGDVVTRDELRETLWPENVFVDFDHGLNSAVNKLRDALGDSAARPRFIETLPRGYRFIAPVSGPTHRASPSLPSEPVPGRSPTTRWRPIAIATALAAGISVIVVGSLLTLQLRARPVPTQVALAVLPFQNLSTDPEQEFFSEGFSDELLAHVGRVAPQQLRVIARTSAMHYKRTNKTALEIGRELGVDYILEGSVLRAGPRVRITGQLVRVSDQAHVWSQSYERDLRDVLALQTEVARAIAEEIEVTFERTAARPPLPTRASVDPQVYEAYLRGRYFVDRSTKAASAVEYFERAIAQDPTYAPAYAGLADAYGQLGWGLSAETPPQETYPKALAAALRALALDESVAAAHVALGKIRWKYEWNWRAAEEALERAIELDPNSAVAHESYFDLLSAMGRHEDAYKRLTHAASLDPVSLTINYDFGLHFARTGDYDRAIVWLKKALELDPASGFVHHILGEVYAEQGQLAEAAAELQRAIDLSGFNSHYVAMLAYVQGLAGDRRAPAQAMSALETRAQRSYVSPYNLALLHTSMGNRQQAIAFLEQAYQHKDPWLSLIRAQWQFEPLAGDGRFQRFLRRMDLPELATTSH